LILGPAAERNIPECLTIVDVVTPPNENSATRRRRDKQENWDRALDWAVRLGDIEVHPHSPLAISDILSQPSGCLDLVPDTTGLAESATDAEVHPAENQLLESAVEEESESEVNNSVTLLNRPNPDKRKRTKANLLTRHSAADLYERCKQIQVMNALVKQPGVQRLYLAAGFLQWRNEKNGPTVRAPLLLFPAILVLKTGENAESERCYELRMDSCTPDLNLELVDVALDRWGVTLPNYKVGEPLSMWYSKVAEAMQEIDSVSLHFDIAVGTACPPQHITKYEDGRPWFPELPEHFDAPLAMAIAESLSLTQLNSVMQLIGQSSDEGTDWMAADAANDINTPIAEIHQLARRLEDVGLERVEFRHLDDLPTRLHDWSNCVREFLKNPNVSQLGDNSSITALQLIRLSSMVELIDREPKEFKKYIHPHLAFHSTRALMRRAQHQAKLIEQELTDLQMHFHLERIPSKKHLLNLVEELGGNNVFEPDVIHADYFNARRQFMEFSVDKPANLTVEHRRLLSQLAKVLRFRELFVTNTEYRQAFGPGYRGLQTNWTELESMIHYAIEMSDHLESEAVAARLLTHWQTSRSFYVDEFAQLQEAAESLRKLLRVVGTSHRRSALDKLVTNATVLADNLKSWRAPDLDLSTYKKKNASDILACFSGLPRADSRTEAAVAETEQRIRQHLKSCHIERKAIVDTLAWLLQASETAARQSLNIDAIVNRFHIA